MPIEFRYPNMAKGTGEWANWVTPKVGKDNATSWLCDVTLDLKKGDKVTSSIDVEFDGFYGTDDGSDFWTQGAVDDKWTTTRNMVTHMLCRLDATVPTSFNRTYCNTNTAYDDNVGSHKYSVGARVNDAGGQIPLSPPHGRGQRRRAARLGARRRGGVVSDR